MIAKRQSRNANRHCWASQQWHPTDPGDAGNPGGQAPQLARSQKFGVLNGANWISFFGFGGFAAAAFIAPIGVAIRKSRAEITQQEFRLEWPLWAMPGSNQVGGTLGHGEVSEGHPGLSSARVRSPCVAFRGWLILAVRNLAGKSRDLPHSRNWNAAP